MQELMGMKIGPYQIQRHLARGGMANVYLARDVETGLEPLVAIKLVHTSVGEYYERFRREAKEHYTLRHDHILPAIAYGEFNSWWYLVTPYVAGGTLTRRLKHGPLSIQNAVEIFSQLADALHYAHEQGIVHRDIKSSNVLMRDEHYAYLADFGLVKHVGLDTDLTLSGYVMGTPEYMAPELAEEDASPRSDIYALGILLYQMLTGQVPFKGTSLFSVYLKHVQEQPVTPTVLNPAIPPEVEQVVLRALAKNPDDRYQTAQDFNIACQQALARANVRQLERVGAVPCLFDVMLPVPQVRLVKCGDLCQLDVLQLQEATVPNVLQLQEATVPRRRRQQRGFVVSVAASVVLILSLLNTSGMDAQSPLLARLAPRPIIRVAYGKGGSTLHLSPTPTVTPTPQLVALSQQVRESTSNNGDGNSVDSSGHGYGDKQGNSNSGNGSGQSHGKGKNGIGHGDK